MTTSSPPPGVNTTNDQSAVPAPDSRKLDGAVLKIAGVVVIGSA